MVPGLGTMSQGAPVAPQIVTHDVHVVDVNSSSSPLVKGLAVALLLFAGVFGYLWLDTGEMSDLMKLLGLAEESIEPPQRRYQTPTYW